MTESSETVQNVVHLTISTDDHTLRSGRYINSYSEKKNSSRNNVQLVNTSLVADRYHLSNTAVAAVGTAVLMDFKLVDTTNTQNVIDPSKVRRQREIRRNSVADLQHKNRNPIYGLYFDGRNDLSMTYENGKIAMKTQHHVSLLQQPGSYY